MPSEEDVSRFIRSAFRSVWALELLRFLRQHRERSLSHQEMVAGLRGSDQVVTQSIDSLTAAGLVAAEADGSARYRPASEELDQLVEAGAALYVRSPDAVRRMIVAAANPAITAFADAFRLRKD
jgi:DNA-binding transcriptional ArsR family regulator